MQDARLEALVPFLSEERLKKFDDVLSRRTRKLCLVLENVYQSRNASAVMRTCDGLGVQDVHLIEDINPWVYNRVVSKGTPSWLTIHRYQAAEQPISACIDRLKKLGFKIAVTSPHVDGFEPHELPTDHPVALVMGTEFKGVSDEMMEAADYCVHIPMLGFSESLNISVAAGVIMHRILENIREKPRSEWEIPEEEAHQLRINWALKSVRKSAKLLAHLGIHPETGEALENK